MNRQTLFLVKQHLNGKKHRLKTQSMNLGNTPSTSKDNEVNEIPPENEKQIKKQFSLDLCKAFLDADISLSKINNPSMKEFLHLYIDKEIPGESTLRKTYVDLLYEDTSIKIRSEINDNNIWISIDETTDALGR